MKNVYLKTTWLDNKTPVNAANMNNIEKGIETLFANAISFSELIPGDGISIESEDSGIVISADWTIPRSESVKGIEVVFGELASYQEGYLYYVLNADTCKLIRIVFNNKIIYEVE